MLIGIKGMPGQVIAGTHAERDWVAQQPRVPRIRGLSRCVKTLSGFRIPSKIKPMGYAKQVQQASCHEVDEIVNGLGMQVKTGIERGDDSACLIQAEHVLQVYPAGRAFAVCNDQGAALLERDQRGAMNEVARDAGSNASHGIAGGRDDDHAIVQERARGNDSAHIAGRMDVQERVAITNKEGAIQGSNIRLFAQEAPAHGRDNEVNLCSRSRQQFNHPQCAGSTTGTCNTDNDSSLRKAGHDTA